MYQAPEALLICSTKDATSGTAAAIEVMNWVNLTWSAVILQAVFLFRSHCLYDADHLLGSLSGH